MKNTKTSHIRIEVRCAPPLRDDHPQHFAQLIKELHEVAGAGPDRFRMERVFALAAQYSEEPTCYPVSVRQGVLTVAHPATSQPMLVVTEAPAAEAI